MSETQRPTFSRRTLLAAAGITSLVPGAFGQVSPEQGDGEAAEFGQPLRMVVMDPLSAPLGCACVGSYAQRDYGKLAEYLQERLHRPVLVAHTESLALLEPAEQSATDIVVGKFSTVRHDARRVGMALRSLAMLSNQEGELTQTGLFLVRADDEAQSVSDLRDRRIVFGPEDSDERHAAALASLEAYGVSVPDVPPVLESCNEAAMAVLVSEADAAVISSHALPLIEGCGVVEKGVLRVIGHTSQVPFVGVFVSDNIDATAGQDLLKALDQWGTQPELSRALDSRSGFVHLPPLPKAGWTDWRGEGRQGLNSGVPAALPASKQLLWSRVLTGHGLAGLAVTDGRLVVADKSLDSERDIFHCLDADTGRELWRISYPALGDMDFTNSPRATPLVHGDRVYLLGAFGHLHCAALTSGEIVWRRNLAEDFDAMIPTWGYCATPLLSGGMLYVNPGGPEASVVSLNPETGREIWRAPGPAAAYAALIHAAPNGVAQIIGYDQEGLNGWKPDTGELLWRLVPPWEGDFNVATPIMAGNRLLVCTENNGARFYGFDPEGRILDIPLCENEDLLPDMSTPVLYRDLVLGSCMRLVCLDARDNLKTLWEYDGDPYLDYCSFIAGNDRILVTTQTGVIGLLKASREGFERVSELDLFDDVPAQDKDVWSFPALVGNRFYIRNSLGVYCFLLEG